MLENAQWACGSRGAQCPSTRWASAFQRISITACNTSFRTLTGHRERSRSLFVAHPLWNTAAHLMTVQYGRALFPTASTSSLWHSLAFLRAVQLFWCRYTVLDESYPFCMMLDLQLSFYYPLLHCLHTKSAILAGVHSYFVVSSFK